ncbi:MAG: hypothetical protein K2L68_03915, partial [Muribaculaceae bacterium]|nr:hypothetical protein [Muribaculaceae bacterium]
MHLALPQHIADYRISPRAATDDLLTLGRYFSEMGGYASSFSLREARSFAVICEKRLCKVTKELMNRQVIDSVDDLFSLSTDSPAEAYTLSSPYDTLTSLSVNDLERIYRSHPKRADLRRTQGREPLTYYIEGKIVAELRRRSPADLSEQLKIDYCIHTYENELENLSFLLSRPVRTGSPLPITDINPDCSSDELLLSIISLKQYRDIISRERLIEYTDIALDRLELSEISGNLPLLAEITEIRRKKIIAVPEWVNSRLEKGVAHALKKKNVKDSDLAVPVLTLYAITGNPK